MVAVVLYRAGKGNVRSSTEQWGKVTVPSKGNNSRQKVNVQERLREGVAGARQVQVDLSRQGWGQVGWEWRHGVR